MVSLEIEAYPEPKVLTPTELAKGVESHRGASQAAVHIGASEAFVRQNWHARDPHGFFCDDGSTTFECYRAHDSRLGRITSSGAFESIGFGYTGRLLNLRMRIVLDLLGLLRERFLMGAFWTMRLVG